MCIRDSAWPGTLVVVSHDRYFVERVCDDVYGLMGDGAVRHLPGGIDQYLQLRAAEETPVTAVVPPKASGAGGAARDARKELARLERALEKLQTREAALHEAMAEAASDHERLGALTAELTALTAEREATEHTWLELSES